MSTSAARGGLVALLRVSTTTGGKLYIGSARGPGGLAARLNHHRRQTSAPHWHIDYLRPYTVIREIWYAQDVVVLEHKWRPSMEEIATATAALIGFDSSDCRCSSHLFRFAPARPRYRSSGVSSLPWSLPIMVSDPVR